MKNIFLIGLIFMSFMGRALLSWSEPLNASSIETLSEKALKDKTGECHTFFDLNDSAAAFLEKEQQTFSKNLPILSKVKIGRIMVVREKIFNENDPEESGKLYRLANDFHVLTKENVIRQQLTFDSGEPLSYAALEESERILRATKYLVDAWVVPYQQCGDTVDIIVMTRDVWSLTPKASYTKNGGQEIFSASLGEVNLFGEGNSVTVGRIRDDENGFDDINTFAFYDPYILGSQADLNFDLLDGDNREAHQISFQKPFRSVYSKSAAGAYTSDTDYLAGQYILGNVAANYQYENSSSNIFGGVSSGLVNGAVTRWTFGLMSEEIAVNNFTPLYTLSAELAAVYPLDLPDRKQVYPWFTYRFFTNQYKKMQNVRKVYLTEDIFTGSMITTTLGYSSESLDASSDQVIVDLSYQGSLLATNQHLLQYSLSFNTNWDQDREEEENRFAGFDIKYYWLHSLRHRTFISFSADAGTNMTVDKVLLLGGTNGLRGYPKYFNAGDRRVLFTAEQRYYSSLHILHLLRVAGAVFFDVGQSRFNHEEWLIPAEPYSILIDMAQADTGFNKSVGVGLRLVSNEAELSSVVHVDLVFPLDRDTHRLYGDEVDSMQFNITLNRTF